MNVRNEKRDQAREAQRVEKRAKQDEHREIKAESLGLPAGAAVSAERVSQERQGVSQARQGGATAAEERGAAGA